MHSGRPGEQQLSKGVAMRHLVQTMTSPSSGAASGYQVAVAQQPSPRGGWLGGLLSALGFASLDSGVGASGPSTTSAPAGDQRPHTSSSQQAPAPSAPPAARPAAPALGHVPALAAEPAAAPGGGGVAAALAGVWQKDVARSDTASYERALDLWQLTPLHKAGARLIEGLRISRGGGRLTITFLTILPESMFKVSARADGAAALEWKC
jgi:hypothetical protein